jgi:hypothetical protein
MNIAKKVAFGATTVALCLTLAVSVGSIFADNFKAAPASDSEALVARIRDLENRVAELEKKQATVLLPAQQAPTQIPRGWSPKTFNGMTYYIVPVDGNEGAVAKPAR